MKIATPKEETKNRKHEYLVASNLLWYLHQSNLKILSNNYHTNGGTKKNNRQWQHNRVSLKYNKTTGKKIKPFGLFLKAFNGYSDK